jgi:mannose-1-phosphate guanylyltransferase
MRRTENSARRQRAAIVLAGGDGARLRSLTKFIVGHEVPKQFCSIAGNSTLLEDTLNRISIAVPIERTAIVVNRQHRPYYGGLLSGAVPRLAEQPCNRGTATAILFGLRHLADLGRDATVAIFPSDHFIGNDEVFMSQVTRAFETIEEFPQLCIALGVKPTAAETGYGWIEPGSQVSTLRPDLRRVNRFWEKPTAAIADHLYRTGCLWNSFILIASVAVLHAMFAEFATELYCTFNAELAATLPGVDGTAANRAYRKLPDHGFSEQILAQCPPNLAVLKLENCQWSDLGEPARVIDVVKSMNRHPRWVDEFVAAAAMAAVH